MAPRAARWLPGAGRDKTVSVSDYNYPHFTVEELRADDFSSFQNVTRVGTPAPGGTVIDASTGETVELATLWRKSHLVMEFGSIT